jgi:GNAT superfamily N-acetyltransferase
MSDGREPVRNLGEEHTSGVIAALCDAFRDYPVMRYVLDPGAGDYAVRLRVLIGLFVMARVLRGETVFGIVRGAQVDAAALVSHPEGSPSNPEFESLRETVWRELGPDARARYEEFSEACRPLLAADPRVHLNMIGVRRDLRGRGLGRVLLDRVHDYSRETPGSMGVSLTTEDANNLPVYERFGYRVTGHARVAPELRTWALFRRHSEV